MCYDKMEPIKKYFLLSYLDLACLRGGEDAQTGGLHPIGSRTDKVQGYKRKIVSNPDINLVGTGQGKNHCHRANPDLRLVLDLQTAPK